MINVAEMSLRHDDDKREKSAHLFSIDCVNAHNKLGILLR